MNWKHHHRYFLEWKCYYFCILNINVLGKNRYYSLTLIKNSYQIHTMIRSDEIEQYLIVNPLLSFIEFSNHILLPYKCKAIDVIINFINIDAQNIQRLVHSISVSRITRKSLVVPGGSLQLHLRAFCPSDFPSLCQKKRNWITFERWNDSVVSEK